MNENAPQSGPLSSPIFLLLLILAIIKDGIEIIIGLIPGLDVFSWIFSLPFAAVIILIVFFTGIKSKWFLIGQSIDIIPFASMLPTTVLTVAAVYATEKSPRLKKVAKVATKVTPSIKTAPPKITKEVAPPKVAEKAKPKAGPLNQKNNSSNPKA